MRLMWHIVGAIKVVAFTTTELATCAGRGWVKEMTVTRHIQDVSPLPSLHEGISDCHQACIQGEALGIPDARWRSPFWGTHIVGFFQNPSSLFWNPDLEEIQCSILMANVIFVLITNETLLTLNEMPQEGNKGSLEPCLQAESLKLKIWLQPFLTYRQKCTHQWARLCCKRWGFRFRNRSILKHHLSG